MKAAIVALLMTMPLPVAAFSWPWAKTTTPEPAPRPVASIIVTDDLPKGHSIPGVIRSDLEVSLAFQTLGRLSRRLVDTGDVVEKDQLLAALDPEDLQDEVRAAQAAADAAAVELSTAQATAGRTRALANRNVATTAQLEQAERGLAAATAAQQQAQSQLVRALDAEGDAEMRAPFSGVISDVNATPGAVVNAGDPIMQLSNQDDLKAVIDLPPAMLARLDPGDPFEIWSEHDPSVITLAHILRVEPVADAATRTRRVHLSLQRSGDFRLGALVRARPVLQSLDGVTVPASAVLTRDGKPHVWRVGQDRKVTLQPIQTATTIADTVAVASGLSPGDEIVIRGIHSLTEGQAVGESVTP
ncbi:efflux RND transporter periplasmic adaptor subunit [Paracoccus shanxieyensis]|uniref:Efflux RND transporter periplasmic adaptor subunit n=1 Tax=Paracoccus shanxieyensis TaxID=2675752 RepID=A0A6L6J4Z0_9RHOB|nr:efflux RND transporter periplasmic adaptor subunit [Paracoccus shanxieyensis]MTH65837.1 efflux RND transporter periplasmic adaptor subunit [Paracoccus shanxieyensis]MTH89121.1 efflux RND transporter periplasmic adaptor subunit [Paracoccus shanxieyensis]